MRLLRGRVVIREDLTAEFAKYTHIIVPEGKNAARDRKFHIGTVLAMGPPALTKEGHEVAHGFSVGDRVVFHWNQHESTFTRPWVDGKLACWIPQQDVDGVVE